MNVNVDDKLVNGSDGILKYIEKNVNGEIIVLWFQFEDKNVGIIAEHKHQNGKPSRNPEIISNWVPIKQSNCSINIDTIAKIVCKRKQFPVTPALAITIQKSQGGTFKEIVYKYSFKQSRHLVYVALSRVTDINGLFITTPTYS